MLAGLGRTDGGIQGNPHSGGKATVAQRSILAGAQPDWREAARELTLAEGKATLAGSSQGKPH